MNKETIKKINKLLEGSDCCVIATNNGSAFIGSEPQMLTCLTMIIRKLKEEANIDDELIKQCFDLASKNEDELLKEALKRMKKMIDMLGGRDE